jgi:hypothetical protein
VRSSASAVELVWNVWGKWGAKSAVLGFPQVEHLFKREWGVII